MRPIEFLFPTQDIHQLYAGERLRLVLSGKVWGVHESKSWANFQTSSAPDHEQPWQFRRLGCGDDLRGIRTEELHAVYHDIMPSKHRGYTTPGSCPSTVPASE